MSCAIEDEIGVDRKIRGEVIKQRVSKGLVGAEIPNSQRRENKDIFFLSCQLSATKGESKTSERQEVPGEIQYKELFELL